MLSHWEEMRERDVLVGAKRKRDMNPSISSVMKSRGQRCLTQSGRPHKKTLMVTPVFTQYM